MKASRRARVLVVEDDSQVRRVLQRLLEARGCEVEAVTETKLALGAMMATAWDAVVVDTDGPGIDGVALHDLALSASPGLERRFVFLGSGPRCPAGVRRVDKPFAVQTLWHAVRAALPRAIDG